MKKSELSAILRTLNLTPAEVADLLSVNIKTVNRWLVGEFPVPGPAEQALRAWVRMHERHVPWRPDGLPINIMDESEIADQFARMREHVVTMDEVLRRVRARGGPAVPWKVELNRCRAELAGSLEITFYPLTNGSFSLSSYRRLDKDPDLARDRSLIEDAVACIAEAVAAAGPGWVNRR